MSSKSTREESTGCCHEAREIMEVLSQPGVKFKDLKEESSLVFKPTYHWILDNLNYVPAWFRKTVIESKKLEVDKPLPLSIHKYLSPYYRNRARFGKSSPIPVAVKVSSYKIDLEVYFVRVYDLYGEHLDKELDNNPINTPAKSVKSPLWIITGGT